MSQLAVNLSSFTNYGISTQRLGFTQFTGNGGFTSGGEPFGGMLMALSVDLTRQWQLYNGIPQAGNEIVDAADGTTLVTKRFFNQIFPVSGYDGTPSYGSTDDGQSQLQHVIIFETTESMSPNQGQVSRGIDQKYRVRFEYDERPRLYSSDREFANVLYQTNLKNKQMGWDEYEDGGVINETDITRYGDTLTSYHPGYTFNGTLAAGWEGTTGIPNPSYGWLKLNVATKNQILENGDVTFPLGVSDGVITLENGSTLNTAISRDPGEIVDLHFEDITLPSDTSDVNRSVRWRNKRKGNGWFKRFPKQSSDFSGTYPMQYRLTLTERGFCFFIMDDSSTDQNDDYAWILSQRTVDNQTGVTRTDESSRFPVHCLYSCSRESTSPRDFGVYFTDQAANLQTAASSIQTVYDESGNSYDIGDLTAQADSLYILSPYDREDYLADEFMAKKIWRFVVREFDILKPWDVHKDCTRHQTDSNAIINPMEQLAITDDNRFVITFPTGLTTQRYMYPKEEIDLVSFSSSEVVAQSSNVPMQTYKPDGTNTDNRRYQGMMSTLPNGNGMRILMLVNGDYIFNSDVNID